MSLPREDEAYGTVSIPVADLRREPADAPGTDGRDDGRQSQLLYNEVLRVMEEQGDWLRVEAIEQQKFLGPVGWGGYPGWVRKGAVAKVEKPPGHNASIKNARAAVADGPSPKAALLFYLSLGTRLATRGENRGLSGDPIARWKGRLGFEEGRSRYRSHGSCRAMHRPGAYSSGPPLPRRTLSLGRPEHAPADIPD